jgi:hypothetical protein
MPSPRKPNFKFEGRMFFSFRVCDIVSTSKGGVTCGKNKGYYLRGAFVQLFVTFVVKFFFKIFKLAFKVAVPISDPDDIKYII